MKDTNTSILTAALLSIAFVSATAPTAAADDRHSHRGWTVTAGEETILTEGFAGPLRVAVGRGNTAYVSQNFGGLLTEVDRKGNPAELYSNPGTEVGGVSVDKGSIYFTESIGGPDEPRPDVANLSVYKRGAVSKLADLNAYEVKNDPDKKAAYGFQGVKDTCPLPTEAVLLTGPRGGEVYSHPFATAPSRSEIYVADAGANAILAVNKHNGAIRTVAALPPVPIAVDTKVLASLQAFLKQVPEFKNVVLPECTVGSTFNSEPVPTDIEIGDDGFLYVTSLPGVPEAPGSGSVLRVNPWSGEITKVATGLTGATGLAIDKRGNIFVAELFAGRISVIAAGTSTPTLFTEAASPADVEIDGKYLYATTNVLPSGPPPGGEPPAEGEPAPAADTSAPEPEGMLVKIRLEYDRGR
ncbi:ScyD/ScyE family protein [Arthrobacter sp. Br18]|uniref:ScyD/ScyE family protein n=1 Tax=Arthrobacter sp. Br18 TaxID=1312954 RepID=UPI0004AE2EAC|nr:ScyD/ScyE family protein [Arthrobacter sp. Br18]